MKSVLHIIESLEFGGAEKVVLQLANGMSKNYKVFVCATKREGELFNKFNNDVTVFSLEESEGNNISTIKKITNIIKNNNIDIVHIHNWGVFIEATIASKLSGCAKTIHTVHGPYISYPNNTLANIKKYVRHTLERRLSKYIFSFISVSTAIKEYMISDIGINNNKINVIHNGIQGLSRTKTHVNNSPVVNFVSVGRVAKIKNHKLLLDCLHMIGNTVNYHLTIVGDGPELDNLKKQSENLSLNNNITFMGFRSDLANILSTMDVCVVTSDYEGISIAILESMSLSLPVIATSVGGNPETVIDSETGILFPKGDKIALCESIKKLSKNRNIRQALGNNGYNRFIKYFHENNVFSSYTKIYEK